MHTYARGSAKASFGVLDSPKTNLDPISETCTSLWVPKISNVILAWTKAGLNQSLLSTPKLPFYEHFDYLSPVLPWLGPQYFFPDPLLFRFLLEWGSIGTPELFDSFLAIFTFALTNNLTSARLYSAKNIYLSPSSVICMHSTGRPSVT